MNKARRNKARRRTAPARRHRVWLINVMSALAAFAYGRGVPKSEWGSLHRLLPYV